MVSFTKKEVCCDLNLCYLFQASRSHREVNVPNWVNTAAPNFSEKGNTIYILKIETCDEEKHCDAGLGDHIVIVTGDIVSCSERSIVKLSNINRTFVRSVQGFEFQKTELQLHIMEKH